MANALPKITYRPKVALDIEVMTFDETYRRLTAIEDHDPFAPHKIQFYFILLVENGNYTHYVDFKHYEIKKGSVLFIAKNQVHHFTPSLEHSEGYCIVLNSNYLEKNYFLSKNINLDRLYNYHLETPLINPEKGTDLTFLNLMQTIFEEYQLSEPFAKQEMLRAYVQILLLKAERIKQLGVVQELNKAWLHLFHRFKTSLENNYSTTRNSRDYAAELAISYKLLNDIVKNVSGKTVKVFIDDFVTMEIKRLLAATNLSVKEISYITGFDEPANMIKFFKRNATMTPMKFRQRL